MIMETKNISILHPSFADQNSYKPMSPVTWHDLGMDAICDAITKKEEERTVLKKVMMNLSSNPAVAAYRGEVFEDILHHPEMRSKILKLLEQVKNLQDYMSSSRNIDKSDSIWTLTRRLKEVNDYILCIEALTECLTEADPKSQGLLALRQYVSDIQSDCYFAELKQDIAALYQVTNKVRSVTLGINLDENYDAETVGIISLNDKQFSNSKLLSAFAGKLSSGDQIQSGNDWNGKYTYRELQDHGDGISGAVQKNMLTFTAAVNPLMGLFIGMSRVRENSQEVNIMGGLNDVANHMLINSVKELKKVLAKYATVSIYSITGLIPEFLYYILWANYIEEMQTKGYSFSKAQVRPSGNAMEAKNICNLKLSVLAKEDPESIIGNDFSFTDQQRAYILTGANRGGKTTITQAIGQLYVMAQGGIYIPGDAFSFSPVDGIYTHFPADEDKTLDFGRLGEECNRFKALFTECTDRSLLLLNESFSTTSFEEGYFIAYDAVRAILKKGISTIYNTHMHKLGTEVDALNQESEISKAASLVVKVHADGTRSYKVEVAPAEGNSYAKDIAVKYGVTFEQLITQ